MNTRKLVYDRLTFLLPPIYNIIHKPKIMEIMVYDRLIFSTILKLATSINFVLNNYIYILALCRYGVLNIEMVILLIFIYRYRLILKVFMF